MSLHRPTVVAAALACLALGACSSDSGSAEELCQAVRADQDLPNVFAGFDPTDATTALDQLRTARVTLGSLKDAAPEEVSDDLQVEIDYVQDLIGSLEAVGPDAEAAEVASTIQTVTDEHPGVPKAATALQAFAEKRC